MALPADHFPAGTHPDSTERWNPLAIRIPAGAGWACFPLRTSLLFPRGMGAAARGAYDTAQKDATVILIR